MFKIWLVLSGHLGDVCAMTAIIVSATITYWRVAVWERSKLAELNERR